MEMFDEQIETKIAPDGTVTVWTNNRRSMNGFALKQET